MVSGWTIIRGLRLVVGLVLMWEGIRTGNFSLAVLGFAFALMPLLNVGCGSATGCAAQAKKPEGQEISFEEIKNK